MSSLQQTLSARIQAVTGIDPELRPATKPQFGHFQSNVALRLAKQEGKPPREVASAIIDRLELADIAEPPELAGPGFINLRLKAETLASAASEQLVDDRVGVAQTDDPKVVVIDYSAPNVAKQMHVGHLRSTIIGDSLNRVLTVLGHTVIPQNHIGDWGTQFGLLVEEILAEGIDPMALDLVSAEDLYRRASERFKTDEEFARLARKRVVLLQSGDEKTLAIWRQLIEISKAAFNAVYARLGVRLNDDHLAGESSYNDDLAKVVQELENNGTAVIDQGALCVFVEGFNAPMIIRKSDGGYGYSTTDLAAIRHRVQDLHADRIIYVVGAEQSFHFDQVFAVATKAGFLPPGVSAEHVRYGLVLGEGGKRLRTREGGTMKLVDLLDAAEEKAAPAVALAAIKYADLSSGLNKDYVFDIDRMVATTGNTGPYLQYAHARTHQVLRKAEAEGIALPEKITVLDEPAEQALALLLPRLGEVVEEVAQTLQPHRLCGYLHDVAVAYSTFYEQCPVLRSEGDVRASRLALCLATQRVLATGLDLLGIQAPDRM
ncbi:arginine--tRNA ligase [Microlunatus sp. Gsoil 973]|uniref:arginine--tRNA ligase n=1 Tax=Microlunatus sp. Gsoil 973 TaxID=2672569 RepID=UPI0012B495AA|nr:arginine--tRNA ligase [Microlunatus sp. Gsoil 973]QGN34699.1 arginine--tRNA ligase [Microlunatus sp. Gsoil 973]